MHGANLVDFNFHVHVVYTCWTRLVSTRVYIHVYMYMYIHA